MLIWAKSEKVLSQTEQLELQLEELQAASAIKETRANVETDRRVTAKPFRRLYPSIFRAKSIVTYPTMTRPRLWRSVSHPRAPALERKDQQHPHHHSKISVHMKLCGHLSSTPHRNGVHRTLTCLNNLIEQDHRGMKSRTRSILSFKNFQSSAITIACSNSSVVSTKPVRPGTAAPQRPTYALSLNAVLAA